MTNPQSHQDGWRLSSVARWFNHFNAIFERDLIWQIPSSSRMAAGWQCLKKMFRQSRILVQLLLVFTFSWLFAFPAIETYQKKEVITITSEKETGGVLAPSITVLSRDGIERPVESFNVTLEKCRKMLKIKLLSIDECIEEETVTQSEVINDVFLGHQGKSLLGRKGLVKEGLAMFVNQVLGKYFTLKYFTINFGNRVGLNFMEEQIFIELHINNNYDIFVHDPKFFTLNYIPTALPSLFRTILVNETVNHYYKMVMTEVEELDLKDDPCEKDEEYNFQVKAYIHIWSAKSTLFFRPV